MSLSTFMHEDHAQMAAFMESWPPLLVQRVWVLCKALLGALRSKPQLKVDSSCIEEAMFLLGGLVSGLLDSSASQSKARAPGEEVSRTYLHAAGFEMGLGCLIELGEIWMRESFDQKGLPDEVCSRFAAR